MRIHSILALIVCVLLAACSGPTRSDLECAAAVQSRVDSLGALQDQLKLPKNLLQDAPHKVGGEFGVMQTLRFFPHLRIEEGFVLDYVYEFGGIGGAPIVYARKENEPPAGNTDAIVINAPERFNLEEGQRAWKQFQEEEKKLKGDNAAWLAAWGELQKRLSKIPDHDVSRLYLKHIVTDGSDEGFIELAALGVVCDQFYLFWHAGYKKETVVLTKEKADKVMAGLGESMWASSPSQPKPPRLTPALLCPKVKRTSDAITVSIHVFSDWGGLSRRTFQISPQFPYRIRESEPVVVVPYHSGRFY